MQTQMPADLSAVADEELATTLDSLIAEFDALHDAESTDIAAMTEIAEAVEIIRGEQTARADAAEAAAEARAALAQRLHPVASDEEAEDDEDADEAEEAITEETIQPAAEEVVTEERELVTASAPKTLSAKAVRARAPKVEAPAPAAPEVVITAAADVPGIAGGATLDTLALAKALHSKARTLSNGSGFVPVASITLPLEHKLGADLAYNLDVIERVTAPSALTASGWCAPSQNLYDLFGVDAGDGLIDLPTVQVTRGGLNVPSYIGLDAADEGLWTWDEDSADDEQTKPCVYVPCPEFIDYRLEAEGLCVTAGNLTDRAFPELTRRFVSVAINAHLHRLSAAVIGKIAGSATGVTMNAVDSSAAGSILHAIDVQVADYRSEHRMSVNSVLEAVFPLWVKELIRADFAMREAGGYSNVTDEQIAAHFAARKVRAQFVHDYQPMYSGGEAQAFPGTIDFLVYAAGGYVHGHGGVIDLGVVRDSALNATNDFTAAWTEQLYLVAQVGPSAREVTVSYDVNGVTGCCVGPVS